MIIWCFLFRQKVIVITNIVKIATHHLKDQDAIAKEDTHWDLMAKLV